MDGLKTPPVINFHCSKDDIAKFVMNCCLSLDPPRKFWRLS